MNDGDDLSSGGCASPCDFLPRLLLPTVPADSVLIFICSAMFLNDDPFGLGVPDRLNSVDSLGLGSPRLNDRVSDGRSFSCLLYFRVVLMFVPRN
jgi:hypothetical protein